ncbi:MAG: GGDEF domain-containing protein [Alphaproteobacteria bacterium]|nr:GGDEF domain-containing protein [Alphaproteobacteria bacterium]
MMAYAERYGARSSVVYFDIDVMKAINDEHGHAAGDAALRHVGDVLTVHIRESDTVGRLGSYEFGVIPVQADSRAAVEKAASLTAAIEGHSLDWEGPRLRLSVLWGACPFDGKENAGEALGRADRAMYAHKQQGADGGNWR